MKVIGIIYYQPISYIIVLCITLVPAWTFITCLVSKYQGLNANVWLNRVLAAIAMLAIIYCTLLGRKILESRMIELRPMYSLVKAKTDSEFYWTLIMNMLLFIPFGMTFPFALPNRFKNRVAITICSAAVISIMVELMQFCFRLGLCETDDVIMNTLGATIGTVSYVIHIRITNKNE